MAHARRLGTSTPTPRLPGDAESRKPLPAEPAANVVVTPAEGSADAQARDEAAAKAEENRRMMDEALAKCKDLGLSPHTSPGWPLLVKLAEASDGEWKELADLVSQGDVRDNEREPYCKLRADCMPPVPSQATLLLPLSSKSSSAAPKGTLGPAGIAAAEEALPPPSLSYAHDHILIGPNARPGPSSTSSAATASTSKGFATLSGLRGVIEEDHQSTPSRTKLTIKTFVCRRDRSWVGELKNKGMRRCVLDVAPGCAYMLTRLSPTGSFSTRYRLFPRQAAQTTPSPTIPFRQRPISRCQSQHHRHRCRLDHALVLRRP